MTGFGQVGHLAGEIFPPLLAIAGDLIIWRLETGGAQFLALARPETLIITAIFFDDEVSITLP